MKFRGIQKIFSYTQNNLGSRDEIFPLLCPVREADWIDGWEYELIHSHSGYAEQDCVFTTPFKGNLKTIWLITHYDTDNYRLEFVRITPKEQIVKINIALEYVNQRETLVHISYHYTGLNNTQNRNIETELQNDFLRDMDYWEKAINHYLQTNEKLIKA